jgi:hypothetical protein
MASLGNSVTESGDDRNDIFGTPKEPPEFLTPPKGKAPVPTTADSVDLSDGLSDGSITKIDNNTYDLGDGSSTFTLAGG